MPVYGKEIVKELNRPLIKDMTSTELYAFDFAKMEPGERAAFRDELFEKPGHGPLASQSEHRIYSEAHARWSDWIKDHPEDDIPEEKKRNPAEGNELASGPDRPAQPRPDGTSTRARPRETGL